MGELPQWYLMSCDPRRDEQVCALVAIAGFETYTPRIPKTRRRNGDKPLFPGYVFTRLDLGCDDWTKVMYLPGVRRLVTVGGAPSVVDEEIVDAIRARIARGAFVPPKLNPGDRIRVVSGAFEHLEGVFCEELTGAERVSILLDMMNRQVRVEVPADQLLHIPGDEGHNGPARETRPAA